MKKKYVIIGIMAVLAAILSVWLLTRPKPLGNINHAYSEPETSVSNISFSGEAGDRIKFSFRSDVKSGDLDILLYNSDGNEVYKLDGATELETFFDLSRSDTYFLAAECDNFVGRYDVKVYEIK